MASISEPNDKVFKASLPGEDAGTSNSEDMSVHSGFDYPKIEEDMVGTVNYTVPAYTSDQTYTVTTVTHNYGYMPLCLCFVEDLDGVMATEFATLPITDGISTSGFACYTTTTQFVITYKAVDGGIFGPPQWDGYEFKFKYQIWVND
jgi:hypothetical protein